MASYTVYLRGRQSRKDGKNAREALSTAARRRRVDVDVRRGPNAASHVASSIGKSIRDVRVPQIFHGEKYVGGVGPQKKYLSVQGQREREAVKDFRRRQRAEVLNAEIDIDELIADDAERARDHALQRAELAEAARGAALC